MLTNARRVSTAVVGECPRGGESGLSGQVLASQGKTVWGKCQRRLTPAILNQHVTHRLRIVAEAVDDRDVAQQNGPFVEPGLVALREEQILADLRACAEEYPAEPEWFIAEGFTPSPMSKEALSLATLDEIISDKPAYIVDEGGHNDLGELELFKDLYWQLSLFESFDSDPPSALSSRNDFGITTSFGWSF